jgi:sulfur-oxidizing protein SoxY
MRTHGPAEPDRRQRIRRQLLAAIGLLPGLATFLWPRLARAARPKTAFSTPEIAAAITALYGDQPLLPDDRVAITLANFVDNGAVVPIEIQITAPGVRTLALFAADNPVPLVARFEFGAGTEPFVGTRIKLASSTRVIAIAETAAGLLVGEREIGVGKGGCQ